MLNFRAFKALRKMRENMYRAQISTFTVYQRRHISGFPGRVQRLNREQSAPVTCSMKGLQVYGLSLKTI